ncbi:uncharacterized protein DSM5745_11228 [Aspergillus mulundensis]|uniref:Aflatoxin regulatory protein domain-containing protein n=1 Tax=Aspergillus mulundensis TaxID=1810919 RepID=A0A3D8QA44_9EURO|nr:hypothetical protein DSM5745_11228 [Aspergillus mulundensis]RDW58537.1 hypothetical protein DSM5745_11228 [Aspergillus mulundensis]
MQATAETEVQYAGDLPPPDSFLDAASPLLSVHDLLGIPQLHSNPFDFHNLESGEPSFKWQTDTSCTDNLLDNSAPSVITADSSVSPIPQAELVCPRDDHQLQNSQGCCIRLATEVLSSMHTGANSCIMRMGTSEGGGRQPQLPLAADAILAMNQSALRAVQSMLNCSCHKSPQVLLLITVICSGITSWHWHVVDIYSRSHSPRRSSTMESTVSSTDEGSRADAQRPDFFIGNHRLGEEVQTVLIRHVVLGMLRELQVVVGDIAGHKGQSAAGAVNEPRTDTALSGVRTRIIAFLKKQLQGLTSTLDLPGTELGTSGPPISDK